MGNEIHTHASVKSALQSSVFGKSIRSHEGNSSGIPTFMCNVVHRHTEQTAHAKEMGSDLNSFASVSNPPPPDTHAQHGKRPPKHWRGTAAQTSTS